MDETWEPVSRGIGGGKSTSLPFTDEGTLSAGDASVLSVTDIRFVAAVEPPNPDEAFSPPPGHRLIAMSLSLYGYKLSPPVTWVDIETSGVQLRVPIEDKLPNSWHHLNNTYMVGYPGSTSGTGPIPPTRIAFVIPDSNTPKLTLTASNGRSTTVSLCQPRVRTGQRVSGVA